MMQSVFKIQYLKAAFLSVLMPLVVVLVIFPFRELFTTTDIVMLQLMWVTRVAVRSNRRVAALTTLVSV
ncbi:MAG: histidine kinase, partial [Pseudomonadota bacterium]|nr:histidine kinase [Pseudomonadota bacterium]